MSKEKYFEDKSSEVTIYYADYSDSATADQVGAVLEGMGNNQEAFEDFIIQSEDYARGSDEFYALVDDYNEDHEDDQIDYDDAWEIVRNSERNSKELDEAIDTLLSNFSDFFQISLSNISSVEDLLDSLRLNTEENKKILEEAIEEYGDNDPFGSEVVVVFYDTGANAIELFEKGGVIQDPYVFGIRGGGSFSFEAGLKGQVNISPNSDILVDSLQGYSSVDNIAGLSPNAFRSLL